MVPRLVGGGGPALPHLHALPLEPLEDGPGELDVLLDESRGDVAAVGDDAHEGVGGELVDEAREVPVAHLHELQENRVLEMVSFSGLDR